MPGRFPVLGGDEGVLLVLLVHRLAQDSGSPPRRELVADLAARVRCGC